MRTKPSFSKTTLLMITFLALGIGNAGATESTVAEWLRHKHQGDICLAAGKTEEAAKAYQKSLALNPKSTEALFNLAIVYYSQKDIAKASETLQTLLKHNSEDIEARYNLACLLVYLGDKEGAFHHFQLAKTEAARCNSFLCKYIEQGLEFLGELENLTPSTQDLILFLLAQGLPAL
jgi:tetratricopeptide (TPR) repeat protein